MTEALERARAAMDRRAWDDAYAQLLAADHDGAIRDPEDLQRLALTAYLTGSDEAAEAGWERAYPSTTVGRSCPPLGARSGSAWC